MLAEFVFIDVFDLLDSLFNIDELLFASLLLVTCDCCGGAEELFLSLLSAMCDLCCVFCVSFAEYDKFEDAGVVLVVGVVEATIVLELDSLLGLDVGTVLVLFVFAIVFAEAETIDDSKTGPPLGPDDCD